jgi:hypothetical protein
MMMGHVKITTTQVYADVDEEKILDDTSGWQEKLDKKRESVLAADMAQKADLLHNMSQAPPRQVRP